MSDKEPNLNVMANNIEHIMKDVESMKSTLGANYVTKSEFKPVQDNYITRAEFAPVKSIAYGIITIIGTAVLGALIGLVVMR